MPAAAAPEKIPNLGPKSMALLGQVGIHSLEQLRRVGAVAAYVKARQLGSGAGVSLNLLWALDAAISGLHWREVAREHRTTLLLALEDQERHRS